MTTAEDQDFIELRQSMVALIAVYVRLSASQIGRDSLDKRVVDALLHVPRQDYVPIELRAYAYADSPLPIGSGKTISQPFMAALMTDLLELGPADRVLEIGTGLGYQAALLCEVAAQVYTVEILEDLAEQAERRLGAAGYRNLDLRIGDGAQGWPEHAPFDKIIVTAAPDLIPPALIQQLKPGGRMVIPAGLEDDQRLLLGQKDETGRFRTEEIIPVRFSPLISSH
jgi:protein-L-isoaspartate(D-aspartate) O-methyltransferase